MMVTRWNYPIFCLLNPVLDGAKEHAFADLYSLFPYFHMVFDGTLLSVRIAFLPFYVNHHC